MSSSVSIAPPQAPSRFRIYLQLGRVSNLPTVWSNVVAGTALGLGAFHPAGTPLCLLAASSLYVGGMFLNDAFDRRIDAAERPERPIPRGWITAGHVFALGFALLGTGILLASSAATTMSGSFSAATLITATLLAASIVLYDAWHKRNELAPWIMGVCRGLVYLTAALAHGGQLRRPLMLGSAALLVYVVGLTWVARAERPGAKPKRWPRALLFAPVVCLPFSLESGQLWASLVGVALLFIWLAWSLAPLHRPEPKIPVSVIRLISGISIVDALFASSVLGPAALLIGPLGAFSTLAFQRIARGT